MKAYFTLLCLILSVSIVFAQQDKSSLSKRWGTMLENAETYEPYKVIKKIELQDFWKNTSDSISAYQREVRSAQSAIAKQSIEIVDLKATVAQANVAIEQLKEGRDDVSYLGIKANKYFYITVLYLLLVGALVLSAALFYTYNNSQVVAIQKTNAFQKLEQEFTEYKQAKFEVEKKLKRELQTQLNELEELKKRS
jgi:hypothetical protein